LAIWAADVCSRAARQLICIEPTGLRLRHIGKMDPRRSTVQFCFHSGRLTCSARTGFRAVTTPLAEASLLSCISSEKNWDLGFESVVAALYRLLSADRPVAPIPPMHSSAYCSMPWSRIISCNAAWGMQLQHHSRTLLQCHVPLRSFVNLTLDVYFPRK